MSEQLSKTQLKRLIEQELEGEGPTEPEFVDSTQDEPAGRIAIYDDKQEYLIAHAPIMRTDGPDRPFLVRTTDTSWQVAQHIVDMIYPEVEEVFNQVDSQLPWGDLGPGSSGSHNNLVWKWETEEQNMTESLKQLIEKELEDMINEKAVSKKQQKFMGMVHKCQETGDCASPEVRKTAKSMKKKDAEDFASTKHKGLPEKKKKKKKSKRKK